MHDQVDPPAEITRLFRHTISAEQYLGTALTSPNDNSPPTTAKTHNGDSSTKRIAALEDELKRTIAARDALMRQALPVGQPPPAPNRLWMRSLMILLGLVAMVVVVNALFNLTRVEPPPRTAAPTLASLSPKRTKQINRGSIHGKQITILPLAEVSLVGRVALTPTADQVAVADRDGRILIYRFTDATLMQTIRAHQGPVRDLVFTARGNLISGGADGDVAVWQLNPPRRLHTLLRSSAPIRRLAVHNERVAVATEQPSLLLIDRQGRKQPLIGHKGWIRAVAFSSDGALLASGGDDRYIRIWDVADKRKVKDLGPQTAWISALRFSPGNTAVAAADFNKNVFLWSLAAGAPRPAGWVGHVRRITDLAFSANGTSLASASLDRTAIVWDVKTGRPRHYLVGHRYQINSVMFVKPNRHWITASSDGTVRLWPEPLPTAAASRILPPPAVGEVTLRHNTSGERVRLRLRDAAGIVPKDSLPLLADFLRSSSDDKTQLPHPRLVQLIYRVAEHFGRQREVVVVSGYRSLSYNDQRVAQSREVSRKSLHTQGKAIDFRIEGIPITDLYDYVKGLRAGGVGLYIDSQFVHIDIGEVRTWKGT